MDEKEDSALKAEAAKREEWRGGASVNEGDAPGHTLPESERDQTQSAEGGSGGVPGTIRPPD